MKKITVYLFLLAVASLPLALAAAPKSGGRMIGVNVLLNAPIGQSHLDVLGQYGKVRDVIYELDALTLQAREADLPAIQALPFVAAANPDAERNGAPVDTVAVTDFADGLSTWNLDVINVTDFGFDNRQVGYDGTGVYVAVLDTGLVDSWRQVFPEERIATEYAMSFGGGGGLAGTVSSQPNKWEHDQNSHGTHVTSTIIGYSLRGTRVNGVAPMATIIPVKVLNQNGSGWSSVIARGIMYVAELKEGPLADYPVVINMSLGGSVLDAVEKAAIDYALDAGVIIVASAGNRGMAGMGYPGAYEPVISVAASGWAGEWTPPGNSSWWWNLDVPEGDSAKSQYYITDFSSRSINENQDLDVAAPGSWIVGPYKTNSSNQPTYYFLGGTSMACPHVAGVAALLLEKYADLSQEDVDLLLNLSALAIPGYGPEAAGAGVVRADIALGLIPLPLMP